MNFRLTALTAATLFTGALAGLAPVAAHAESTGDSWQYSASIYAWLPALSGTTAFPVTTGGTSMDVTSQDVIDSLKMAFMGTISAKKGQWGLWSDLVYADLGADKAGSHDFSVLGHPAGSLSADLSLDMKMWVWTAAGTYELAKSPENTTDLVFGTRLLDVKETLGWSFIGTGPVGVATSGTKEVNASLWDAIIGVKGVAYLGAEKKWFVPYYADIGTGQSDLTWQVNAGIGYRYNWGAVVASWRYLDYNMKSGDPIQSLTASGPLIGVNWQW
jgi:hypothetical protein